MVIKVCPGEQDYVGNILKLKSLLERLLIISRWSSLQDGQNLQTKIFR